MTSIKEGWGLVVTEAAGQGTPAVVYDADGLRDSVRHAETGLVTDSNPQALAGGIKHLLTNESKYRELRRRAWEWSKSMTFDQSYNDFKKVVFA
jgi:glycosyltransferase involved in cell wall biosynthesis